MAGKTFFTIDNGSFGRELWITDGTDTGTSSLAATYPALFPPDPTALAAFDSGRILFVPGSGINHDEIWVTDGTASGTSVVQTLDLAGGFTVLGNGKAVFPVFDGVQPGDHGVEIGVTDGTPAGTSLLKDINPGTAYGSPFDITPFGTSRALFSASDGVHGDELWITDATTPGTSLLIDIAPGAASSFPEGLQPLGNGRTTFTASDGTHGRELWITDGTAAGTSMVKDIKVTAGNSGSDGIPPFFEQVSFGNGTALFVGDDGSTGPELWITDGSAAGTSLLKDINSGSAASDLSNLTVIGSGRAVFVATTPDIGAELWITDGTTTGTSLVKDIWPDFHLSSYPEFLAALGNGKAVFRANDPALPIDKFGHAQSDLWVTDGTAAGTSAISTVVPSTKYVGDPHFTPLGNGQVLFSGFESAHGFELWITDGTAAGTSIVKDIRGGGGSSNPSGFTVAPACFAAGTCILTETGDRPVETLRRGERVLTIGNVLSPIIWIGHRHVDLIGHSRPADVMPVRIHAGAFGPGRPARDVRLSPDHAVYIDGVLIPVRHLINGGTIAQEEAAEVTWWHVELARHDVIFADGLPAESYLDTGDRASFTNGDGPMRQLPDVSTRTWEAFGCAPLVITGPRLHAVRQWLSRVGTTPVVKTASDAHPSAV